MSCFKDVFIVEFQSFSSALLAAFRRVFIVAGRSHLVVQLSQKNKYSDKEDITILFSATYNGIMERLPLASDMVVSFFDVGVIHSFSAAAVLAHTSYFVYCMLYERFDNALTSYLTTCK